MLMMKWVARKFNITRVNNILGKLHKPLGVIALILGIVHFIVVIPVMKNRDVLVNFTGVLAFVLMVAIIVSCHVTRNNKVKMKLHRIFTIIAFACIIGHVVTYFADFMEYQNNIENIENLNDGYRQMTMVCFGLYSNKMARNMGLAEAYFQGEGSNDDKKSDTECRFFYYLLFLSSVITILRFSS